MPPHRDFEQGTGHFHDEVEELYIVTRGTLTMRFGEDVREVSAPAAVRVAPRTPRSHRNEGDEPVEMWAVSRQIAHGDATKIDDFWAASPHAAQSAGGWTRARPGTSVFAPVYSVCVSHRPLAIVSGLTIGDYLLWNWSLNANHDVLALVSGLTLPPLAIACAVAARADGRAADRAPLARAPSRTRGARRGGTTLRARWRARRRAAGRWRRRSGRRRHGAGHRRIATPLAQDRRLRRPASS